MIVRHIGVDGCRAGWLAVSRNQAGLQYRVFKNAVELAAEFPNVERILIDVPIGLPWSDLKIRPCDQLARRLLGRPRGSSVFAVPCRDALCASTPDEAKKINKAIIDRSIGSQTLGICSKIAEIDHLLLSHRRRYQYFREVHPEVCFWALAGKKPMVNSKKKPEGIGERIQVLQRYEPEIRNLLSRVLLETLRKDVAPDDVLDAAIAFVTSEERHGELTALAGDPSHDHEGLPMKMLFLNT